MDQCTWYLVVANIARDADWGVRVELVSQTVTQQVECRIVSRSAIAPIGEFSGNAGQRRLSSLQSILLVNISLGCILLTAAGRAEIILTARTIYSASAG